MKNIIRQSLLVILLAFVSSLASAQPLNRKADTKIVDALNQLPADNLKLYNRLMSDIESTGTDGIEMLIAMLERNDKSRTKVEYALDAYAAYAGSASFDAQKRDALKVVLSKHIAKINAGLSGNDVKDCEENPWAVTNRELLVRMLRHISGYVPTQVEPNPDVAAIQKTLAKVIKGKDRSARMAAIQTIDTYGNCEQVGASLALAEKLLPKLNDDAKIDVLYWLGINPDKAETAPVKALLASKNPEVVNQAAWTLTRIGKAEDMSAVAALLNSADADKVALANACLRCYPGDVASFLADNFAGNETAKSIISHRKGTDVPVVELTPFEKAITAIKRSIPGEQRLQKLSEAMKLATSTAEKEKVLALVARTNVLPAVFYCGEYLENAETQQAAAQAIRILTSGHDEMNGSDVIALMMRAKEVITGDDADYQRIEIQNQIDRLNAEAAKHHSDPYELSAKEKKEGFKLLFDGTNLDNFQGDFVNYHCENGNIYVKPRGDGFGNLYTKEEYQDFIFRFEFKLTPGANNGIGVRAEMGKDAAYYGMEIQVLDHYNDIYQPGLRDYQYHGSVYGIIPTQNRDCLKPVGEWNEEEIYIKGTHVRVTLNGTVITEGDIKEATKNGTYDHNEHPGLFNKTGYIGFLGHGSELWFRHVRVKRL